MVEHRDTDATHILAVDHREVEYLFVDDRILIGKVQRTSTPET